MLPHGMKLTFSIRTMKQDNNRSDIPSLLDRGQEAINITTSFGRDNGLEFRAEKTVGGLDSLGGDLIPLRCVSSEWGLSPLNSQMRPNTCGSY